MSFPELSSRRNINQKVGPYALQSVLQHRPAFTVYGARLDGETDGDQQSRLVKVSHEALPAGDASRRLELEAALLEAIDSDVVAVPLEVGRFDGRTVLDFGPLDAVTVADVLRWRRRSDARLDVGDAVRITLDALSAAASMPSIYYGEQAVTGLVCHGWGDATLMVTPDGRVKALGVSEVIVDGKRPDEWVWSSLTAPEYCQPGPPVTVAADIYAAGALLFKLLTLRPVISGSKLNEYNLRRMFRDLHPLPSDVSEDLAPFDPVVDWALRRDPGARYDTARQFTDELIQVARDAGVDYDTSLSALYMEAREMGTGAASAVSVAAEQQLLGTRATEIL